MTLGESQDIVEQYLARTKPSSPPPVPPITQGYKNIPASMQAVFSDNGRDVLIDVNELIVALRELIDGTVSESQLRR